MIGSDRQPELKKKYEIQGRRKCLL